MSNRTKRDRMKRKLAQAHRNQTNVMLDLKTLYDLFEGVHNDLAEGLELSAELVLQSQRVLETFANNAWGMDVDAIEHWL